MTKVVKILVVFTFFTNIFCYSQNDSIINYDTISKEQLDFQLVVTASKGDATTVLYLLGKGADVNAVADNGISALMYASQGGYLQVVKTLVANGANINYFPEGELSSISAAITNNHYDIVEYLLYKGANKNIADSKNITPLIYASAYGYFDIVRLLLQYRTDINKVDTYGNSALMMSVLYNHPDVSELLLLNGATPDVADNHLFTPFLYAAQSGNNDYINLFKTYKSNIYHENIYSYSAFDLAVLNNMQNVITKLHEIDTLNKFCSNKPVKLAYLTNNKKIIPLLKTNGCKPYYLPIFKKLIFGYGTSVNFNDMLFGTTIGLAEVRYNLLFSTSYYTKYWANRILINYGNDVYNQFWERRSYVSLGIDKKFNLINKQNISKGIFASLNEFYTYGHYRGSEIKPQSKFMLVPDIGYFIDGNVGGIKLMVEYANFNYGISPFRLNTLVYFNINFKSIKKNLKSTEW